MQTTGACLFAFNRCGSQRVQTPAQDSRSAHGLLYPAAVRDDQRQHEHCQDGVDISPASLTAPESAGRRLLSCDVSGPAVGPLHPYTTGRGSAGLVGDPEAFTSRPTDALPIPGPDAATDAARC